MGRLAAYYGPVSQHRKKYLRAGEEMPRYTKQTNASKLDPYAEKLATRLAIEATRSLAAYIETAYEEDEIIEEVSAQR